MKAPIGPGIVALAGGVVIGLNVGAMYLPGYHPSWWQMVVAVGVVALCFVSERP